MTPEEALRRAEQAGQVLNTQIVKDTLDLMEKEVMEAWMACPVRDVEGRETLWRMAVTTRKFREILKGTMESGKLAKDQIKQKQSFMDKVRYVSSSR